MSTLINKTQEITEELKKQNNIQDVDYKILEEIDRIMKDIHQDYIIKSYHSWIESENCYVYQNLN
ncbi:MAG TPA: hypothetical protein PLE51_00695 [Candidatus Pacearchaeota archaeon]|nr:hypothetical protein [Candidatus Pacearchaeota archaeon]HOU79274.1 hypothetical protein [Candidatus Pacearchaeota archaeon]HPJ87201.1 hypothetical protein [Candidatus Pacearchaeota archaeon]HQF82818.1 hypothetical protein [Candidatus Pacearchaeota archaeon]